MGSPEEGGALLKELLKRHRYRAKDLAEHLDVSISSVRAWTAGRYAPREDHAAEAAWWLLGQDGHQLLSAWGLDEAAEAYQRDMEHLGHQLTLNDDLDTLLRRPPRFISGSVAATEKPDTAKGRGFALPPDVHTFHYTGQELTEANKKIVQVLISALQQQQPGASWYTEKGTAGEAEAAAQQAYETAMGNRPDGDEEDDQ